MTTVGYAGGQTPNPTYYKLGDHTECVDIYFNPNIINFTEILKVFLKSHNPTERISSQYKSLIIVHNTKQATQAEEMLQGERKSRQKTVLTTIKEFDKFFRAEPKHQKNQLRRHPALINALVGESLATSYVATRLNGYVGGNNTMGNLNREWKELGLTNEIVGYVRQVVIKRN